MGYIAITRRQGARHRHAVTTTMWVVTGVVAVIFFGDALTVLAVGLAIVTAAWWIARAVQHRASAPNAGRKRLLAVEAEAAERQSEPLG